MLVEAGVFSRVFERVRIDIDADGRSRTQLHRGDREHAGSAPDIEHRAVVERQLLQRLQHQPRRRMVAGAKPHGRLDDTTRGREAFSGFGENSPDPFRVPRRGDDDAADGDRPQLRLRARGPVFVLDVERLDKQVAAERTRQRARGGVAGFGVT